MTRVLLDATTLIALGSINELEICTALDGELVVCPAVLEEITSQPAKTNCERFIEAEGIETTAPENTDHLECAASILDESTTNGDVEIIGTVLAETAAGEAIGVVSDDRRVRTTADGLGALVTGTIGILIRAVETGLSTESALDILDRIDSRGLHMTGSLRQKAETLIEEAADRD